MALQKGEPRMTPSRAPLRFLGTWRVTQSDSSRPDLPYPKSGLTTFTQEADSVHYEAETLWSDGCSSQVKATLKLDGSWCPVTGSSVADSVSFRADGDSFDVEMRKHNAEAGTNRTTISSTGRTMTTRWEIPCPDGETIVWKTASERQ
jgi:hypothetical protein